MKSERNPACKIGSPQRVVALGVAALHALCASAWAQKPGNIVEPEGTFVTLAIGLGVVVLACAPALLNAKRTHLN